MVGRNPESARAVIALPVQKGCTPQDSSACNTRNISCTRKAAVFRTNFKMKREISIALSATKCMCDVTSKGIELRGMRSWRTEHCLLYGVSGGHQTLGLTQDMCTDARNLGAGRRGPRGEGAAPPTLINAYSTDSPEEERISSSQRTTG